jgi:hypothetical protein
MAEATITEVPARVEGSANDALRSSAWSAPLLLASLAIAFGQQVAIRLRETVGRGDMPRHA